MGGGYGSFEAEEVIAAIHRGLDLGITLFDTARGYGVGASEELLGKGLGARRKEAIVVTKGALPTREGQMDDKPTRPGKPRVNPGRDARYASVIADCEDSLQSLGTDYVDLYLIHWPDPETSFEETARALHDLMVSGKTRYVGVSNYEAIQLREACGLAPLVTNQVGYNLFDRRWEYEMMPMAKELGVGIMAYGPLAHGLLTGTFNAETTFEEGDWRRARPIFGQTLFSADNFGPNLEVVDQLKQVAAGLGTTLPRLALAWVLSNEQVSVALSGTRRPAELDENVGALGITLTPEIQREIAQIMTGAAGHAATMPYSETPVPAPPGS
ncbi:MAG: hypothetical protein CL878_06535 [Dehalococcoidia bacterium]|nr:hypothetical protein [Dehalococcoidia bacterium]